jgi:cytochrome c oxidase cbb3-type subunit 3
MRTTSGGRRAASCALLSVVLASCKLAGAGDATANQPDATAAGAPVPLAVRYEQHVNAGGSPPPSGTLANPFRGDAASAAQGGKLFSSMNCDGCHGGAADGWVGPSLIDGRWRYGGTDAAVFQSIYYGRPNGMPAYGGIATPELTWKLVTWLQAQKPPKSVPTTSW